MIKYYCVKKMLLKGYCQNKQNIIMHNYFWLTFFRDYIIIRTHQVQQSSHKLLVGSHNCIPVDVWCKWFKPASYGWWFGIRWLSRGPFILSGQQLNLCANTFVCVTWQPCYHFHTPRGNVVASFHFGQNKLSSALWNVSRLLLSLRASGVPKWAVGKHDYISTGNETALQKSLTTQLWLRVSTVFKTNAVPETARKKWR